MAEACSECGQAPKRQIVPPTAQLVIAIVMLAISLVGFALAAGRVLWTSEPYATLLLSWGALAYAGFVALEVS